MRISTFVPAVLALTFFSASQAHKVHINKNSALVHDIAKLTTKAAVEATTDISAELTASICADIHIKAHAKGNVLNLVHFETDVNSLTKTRAAVATKLNAEAKAEVDLQIHAAIPGLSAQVPAIVKAAIQASCKNSDSACIKLHVDAIVKAIEARIQTSIKVIINQIAVKVRAHLRVRAKVIVPEVCADLGIANLQTKLSVRIASDTHVDLKVCIKAFVAVWADVNLHAKASLKALLLAL
jgi:hypothetical protein